jgi:hypothetical protein
MTTMIYLDSKLRPKTSNNSTGLIQLTFRLACLLLSPIITSLIAEQDTQWYFEYKLRSGLSALNTSTSAFLSIVQASFPTIECRKHISLRILIHAKL